MVGQQDVPRIKQYELGASAILNAFNNGVVIARAGDRVELRKTSSDTQLVDLTIKTLKLHKDEVKSIVCDEEKIKQTLCEARTLLLEACRMSEYLIDQLDGIEKAYRLVHPEDSGCIYGDNPCTAEDIVKCTVCAGGQHGNI
jgi:hypothetical protein